MTEIGKLRKEIEKYPKGTLVINRSKGKAQWFVQRKNQDGTSERAYIKRSEISFAQKLARKSYDKAVLADKENELCSIDRYLKCRKDGNFRKYLQIGSPYRELLTNDRWDFESYEKSCSHPENLVVSTLKGDMVRSKSEAMIANELLAMGIPYRYENPIVLDGRQLHPDFTVKSLKNDRLIIWEHFGKADDPDYVENNILWRLEKYLNNGYIPGYNLIITFEDKKHPLTLEMVRNVIQEYLI